MGDLHGQVADLIYILDESGLPSPTNKYIFNGDFVDRGNDGVEVMCVLLSLLVSEPHSIVLNRGNHEDERVNEMYGFSDECIAKYDEGIFALFVDLFNHLPVCALVDKSVFVIHGGLFADTSVTLDDIAKIDRTDLVTSPEARYEFFTNIQFALLSLLVYQL